MHHPTYSFQDIEQLHKKYAPSDLTFEIAFTHCRIVWDIARQLIENRSLAVDVRLVEVGCLLHDIGVYPLFDASNRLREGGAYMTHGIKGEAILKAEGFPEEIWRIASHHTGVGLTAADVVNQRLPLPPADYTARTDEELLIMYADKFHSKTTPPCFNSYDWYAEHIRQFGGNNVAKFRAMAEKFGIPDLAPLSQKYGYQIR